MLPEGENTRREYIELRDCRTRWRQMQLRALHGDLDAFQAYVLDVMADDAEMVPLREVLDFAREEGDILTAEILEAADNAVAWGAALRLRILAQLAKGVGA